MNTAYLRRFNYGPHETEGELILPGVGVFATIEPPWRNNRRFESCVPDGVYDLVQHDGRKYRGTVALVNPALDVVHKPEDREHEAQRTSCVIHAANFAYQLHGCIAPGLRHAILHSQARGQHLSAVTQSRRAIERIAPVLRQGGWQLAIRAATGARLAA